MQINRSRHPSLAPCVGRSGLPVLPRVPPQRQCRCRRSARSANHLVASPDGQAVTRSSDTSPSPLKVSCATPNDTTGRTRESADFQHACLMPRLDASEQRLLNFCVHGHDISEHTGSLQILLILPGVSLGVAQETSTDWDLCPMNA